MSKHRQTILVTGAAGRVGSGIAGDLRRDFDLVLTDTQAAADKDPQITAVDLLDHGAVQKAMRGVDMVLHLAIAASRHFAGRPKEEFSDAEMRVNVMGTQHVFAAAHEAGIGRIVYMSSMTIDLGSPPRLSFSHDTPVRPNSLYACTKLFGEQLGELYARQYGMSVICLRLGQPIFVEVAAGDAHLSNPWSRGILVALEDVLQAVRCALSCKGIRYKVARIVSESDTRVIDLGDAENIGYRPTRRFTEHGVYQIDGAAESKETTPRAVASMEGQSLRIAAICTAYYPASHADVIISRWLQPRAGDADWGWPGPRSRIVSAYVEQFPANDMARQILRRNDVPLCDSIADALAENGELRADAVLLIGEHGDYPYNQLGQHLYPRKALFDEIVAVYRNVGAVLPLFCDKHLSWNQQWAQQMMQTAFDMGFLLFGGSALPYCRLSKPFPIPERPGQALREIVAVYYGDDESYGFHSLEFLQRLIENRRSGEAGIRSITAWRGDQVWEQMGGGTWSRQLMEAAIDESDAASTSPEPKSRDADYRRSCATGAGPTAFQLEYRGALKVTHINLSGHVGNWGAALRDPASGQIRATAPILGDESSHYGHFATLCRVVEDTLIDQQPLVPPFRLLLTTGQTAAVMRARAQAGTRLYTPELSINYNEPTRIQWHDDGRFG